MKRIILMLLTAIALPICANKSEINYAEEIILRFGDQVLSKTNLPAKFRTCKDPLSNDSLLQGLREINASGSAEFSADNFENMINEIRVKGGQDAIDITIIDLRKESHCFINGISYHWYLQPKNKLYYADYNLNKTTAEIEQDELIRIHQLSLKDEFTAFYPTAAEQYPIKIDFSNHKTFSIETITNEKELVTKHGAHYFRLPIIDRYPPTPEQIDAFLTFIKSHKNTWFHFHCYAGLGRTTIFFAFLDMMHNAKNVSLETIIERHALLGGEKLLDQSGTGIIKESQEERSIVTRSLYQYCKENNDDYTTSYSSWLNKKNEKPVEAQPSTDKLTDNNVHKKFKSMRIQL